MTHFDAYFILTNVISCGRVRDNGTPPVCVTRLTQVISRVIGLEITIINAQKYGENISINLVGM